MNKYLDKAIKIIVVAIVGPLFVYFSLIYTPGSNHSNGDNEAHQERIDRIDEELEELRDQANIKMKEMDDLEDKFSKHKEEQRQIFNEIDKAIASEDDKEVEVLLAKISVNDGFTGNFIKVIDNKQETIIILGDQIQQLLEERHQLIEEALPNK